MNGDERRKKIINILSSSKSPVAGVALAKELDVSRQVIVQDIALLRANGAAIFSTNRGYLILSNTAYPPVSDILCLSKKSRLRLLEAVPYAFPFLALQGMPQYRLRQD